MAGRVDGRARHAPRDAARRRRRPSTRPISSPSSSAAIRFAATSSTTPSASSRKRCGGSARSSCGWPIGVRVPAGAALAVDREQFCRRRDRGDRGASADSRRARRDRRIPPPAGMSPVIVATGPLTSRRAVGRRSRRSSASEHLAFFDAISPIVLAETIDHVEGLSGLAVESQPARRWPPPDGPPAATTAKATT